jgi:3-oxoadipate enol-lactonase
VDWETNGASDGLTSAVAGIIMSPGYDHSSWIAKWEATPKEAVRHPFRTLMDRDDISDRVSEIVAPTIIFHGENDVAIPMEKAEYLARELPKCEGLVRIAGAGHAANLSHPDDVSGPLREFLRRHA